MTDEVKQKYSRHAAAQEITRLKKYRELVLFIANDTTELSHEKAQWQRDDWKKRCEKLFNELENDKILFYNR